MWGSLSRLWKSYFNFSKGERNASAILIILILLTAAYPMVDARFVKLRQTDFSEFKRYAASLSRDSIAENDSMIKDQNDQYFTAPKTGRFKFDPNTVSAGELQNLGFKKYIAARIIKYRSSGGKFRYKEDLSKIYGIDTVLVKSLWNEISLPEKVGRVWEMRDEKMERKEGVRQSGLNHMNVPCKPVLIDLNTADTTTLILLPGIGSKLAKRIVDFRERLGGFYSLEQLKEVYGLRPETIEVITPRLVPDLSPVRIFDVNKATFEELVKHPYVSRNLASAILNYRHQHGNYKSLEDLRKIAILDDVTFKKLINYIKL